MILLLAHRRKFALALAVLVADLIVGPALLVWELQMFREMMR